MKAKVILLASIAALLSGCSMTYEERLSLAKSLNDLSDSLNESTAERVKLMQALPQLPRQVTCTTQAFIPGQSTTTCR